MTEDLSYQSLSEISLYRAAELLRRRYTQPPNGQLVGFDKQGAESGVNPRAGLVDRLKLRVTPNSLMWAEPQVLFAADRQPLPPLGPAPLQHEAAVLGAHADEEPMRRLAMARIGLKCALPLHSVLRKCKRTFNGSEGIRRLSNGMGLCYSLRPSRHIRGSCSSVSQQSFPHLWKKLWKIPENPGAWCPFGRILAGTGDVAVAKVGARPLVRG
jgi:hypothetical protein